MPYVKIDDGILDSTVWADRTVRDVFLTALFMAAGTRPHTVTAPIPQIHVRTLDETGWVVPPGEYGFVRAAGIGIVRRAGIEDEEAGLAALEKLGEPEPDSRSPEHGGRRMVRIPGGYLILNYMAYRDKDYTAAARMRRLRKRKREERDGEQRHSDENGDGGSPERYGRSTQEAGTTYDLDSPPLRSGESRSAPAAPTFSTTAVEEPAKPRSKARLGAWESQAAPILRAAGVPEGSIGDALANFWGRARRHQPDDVIRQVVIAEGEYRGAEWNPAAVWNLKTGDGLTLFNVAVQRVLKRPAAEPLATRIGDVLRGGQ